MRQRLEQAQRVAGRVLRYAVRRVLLNVLVVWPVYSVTYLAGLIAAAFVAGWHDGWGEHGVD